MKKSKSRTGISPALITAFNALFSAFVLFVDEKVFDNGRIFFCDAITNHFLFCRKFVSNFETVWNECKFEDFFASSETVFGTDEPCNFGLEKFCYFWISNKFFVVRIVDFIVLRKFFYIVF